MRFKGLDLNLLVVLDALLAEQSVSRAAEKLFLSQSATSGALARLREYFGDDLLVQVGRKMMLTPRAMSLSDKVRMVLLRIDGGIIQSSGFDPATVKREIRIVASDYMAIAGLRDAMRAIGWLAPDLSVSITPPMDKPREALERGEVDLLIMPEMYISPDHPSTRLFEDEYVVVVWAGNKALGDTITEDEFYGARHAAVKFPTGTPSYESWFMKNHGLERNIVCVVGSFSALPFLIEGTDRIGLMHRRLARIFAALLPIRLLPCPIEIPPLKVDIQWHAYSEADECLAWVRTLVTSRQLR